jgi:hypothetical protein
VLIFFSCKSIYNYKMLNSIHDEINGIEELNRIPVLTTNLNNPNALDNVFTSCAYLFAFVFFFKFYVMYFRTMNH